MKKHIMSVFVMCLLLASLKVYAQTAEEIDSTLIGQWKLIHFEGEGFPTKDYSSENIIWSFDGNNFTLSSDDLGQHSGPYKVSSVYFWGRRAVAIIPLEGDIKDMHIMWGKLYPTINGNTMIADDISQKYTYTLEKIQ